MPYAPIILPPFNSAGTVAWWILGTGSSIVIGATVMIISPDMAVSFGTAAMLFATPVAVIVNTVMARHDAKKASDREKVVAEQTAQAAKLLLESNEKVANTARDQGKKLDQIHTLVNSNLTAAMESELGAHRAGLVIMQEMADLKKSSGVQPSVELLTAMDVANRKIAELQARLIDRLKQS